MCENGPLFQHRYFLHDKFLVNDGSLQIVGPSKLLRRLRIVDLYHVGDALGDDFAHNVDQWIILNYACMMRQ